eukprot:CAMPEP_0177492642 /NCGR_PEP_ID=MMETSP0369-20130122/32465_1 /TAXON_ID=447022 ORGANISM="Scrippsiella hangoei-like, Strain SHHI-4" /NCGR_SAMPLE_ID=MMETSP0369 /ASSEMBLY_ACC=CAM_ASM_000364 /LENGTH=273 /DNA_ID=CAMNT_0018969425 /DNA_START=191 /DNA_END=1013 /DNA_ORIENTATION=-
MAEANGLWHLERDDIRLHAAGPPLPALSSSQYGGSCCRLEHCGRSEHHHSAGLAGRALTLQQVNSFGRLFVRDQVVWCVSAGCDLLPRRSGGRCPTCVSKPRTTIGPSARDGADVLGCSGRVRTGGLRARAASAHHGGRVCALPAGAVAAPCYEIHGKAIVKLAHFLPLHATEVLLLLTWAIDHASVRDGHILLHVAAAGCWSISIIGLWQTFIGEDLRSPGLHVGVAVLFSLGCVPIAFLRVLFAPLSGGKHGRQIDPSAAHSKPFQGAQGG